MPKDSNGELIASPAQSTNIFLTDAQGTVLATFSNTQGSAAVLANQLYGPYGTVRYSGGSMAPYTDKGYTGQYADALLIISLISQLPFDKDIQYKTLKVCVVDTDMPVQTFVR